MLRRFLNEEGAVSVEFALIAPVMLFMVSGIIYFGHYFAIAGSLQQLAAETARASVRGLDASERCQLARTFLSQNSSKFAFLNSTKISGNIKASTCDASAMITGQHPAINVVLTYDLQGTLIFVANTAFGSSNTSMTRSSYLAY